MWPPKDWPAPAIRPWSNCPATAGAYRSISDSRSRMARISFTCSRQEKGPPGRSESRPPTRALACVVSMTGSRAQPRTG